MRTHLLLHERGSHAVYLNFVFFVQEKFDFLLINIQRFLLRELQGSWVNLKLSVDVYSAKFITQFN